MLLLSLAGSPAAGAGDGASVSNVWVDTPLSQVLRDVSLQAKVTVAVDPSVADRLVSLEAEEMSLRDALERVTAAQGLSVRRVEDDLYVVGSVEPDSPSFSTLARTRRLYLDYVTARHVRESLPRELQRYVTGGRRNTEVLVFAPRRESERIMEIVEQLDVPRRQVVLEALVVELSQEGRRVLGVDWTRSGPDTLFNLTEMTENFVGVARYTSVDERRFRSLMLTIRALLRKGKAEVRSRPRVATVNGEKATIDVGLEEFFNIVTDVNGAFLRTELQVVKSGVMLEMTPQIGRDGDITVQVKTEVSDVESRRDGLRDEEELTTALEASVLPIIRRRKAETTVRVKEGEAIVIGGLIESEDRFEENKVPVLASIPLLGALFRSREKTTVENEVVIFITPRLMGDEADPLSGRHEIVNVESEVAGMRSNPKGAKAAEGTPDDAR